MYLRLLPPTLGADDPERVAVERVRYKHLCKRLGYFPPNEAGRERDSYDDRAMYVTVMGGPGKILACARLVWSSNKCEPLPLERYWAGVDVRPTWESGRVVNNCADLRRGRVFHLLLYVGIIESLRRANMVTSYGFVDAHQYAVLQQEQETYGGWRFAPLGPAIDVTNHNHSIIPYVPIVVHALPLT